MEAMKEYKVGDRIVLKKKCKVLEVVEHSNEEIYISNGSTVWVICEKCYYFIKSKCRKVNCLNIYFKDITDTLSENDKLLLERGLLKL